MIAGYGGFWFSRQEAHISTIAVRPDWRGHGLGEILLAGMVRRALFMEAEVISLEVRVSNEPAIALYRKYDFARFGIKRGYYRDNNEDAFDLRVSPVDSLYHQRFAARWEELHQRRAFEDAFTEVAQPRLSLLTARGSGPHPASTRGSQEGKAHDQFPGHTSGPA